MIIKEESGEERLKRKRLGKKIYHLENTRRRKRSPKGEIYQGEPSSNSYESSEEDVNGYFDDSEEEEDNELTLYEEEISAQDEELREGKSVPGEKLSLRRYGSFKIPHQTEEEAKSLIGDAKPQDYTDQHLIQR